MAERAATAKWWRRRLGAFNVAVIAGGVVVLPAALALKRDLRTGLRERFGEIPPTPNGQAAIWVHGASVGELVALAPVVHALRTEFPDHRLVLSSMTVGGRTAAATRVPGADAYVLFPLDVPFCVARALDRVRPRLVLFSETELWPNFFAALAARGIPAVMVSGRVSPRAFARYRRWRWLFAPALASVRWFGVQSLDSARRLVALGAPPARLVVTGSLKTAPAASASPPGLSLASLGVADLPVLVAASTHAGEEDVLLAAFARLRAQHSTARLLLAPRKPDRTAEVTERSAAHGLSCARRSALGPAATARWPAHAAVLVLDTLGELAGLFAGARLAFVGGTLVPVGGHNLLEPAAAGTGVIFGPFVDNVRREAERLIASGGGFGAANGDELATRLVDLFLDGARAAAAGASAQALVAELQGPLAVTLALVRGTLAATIAEAAR